MCVICSFQLGPDTNNESCGRFEGFGVVPGFATISPGSFEKLPGTHCDQPLVAKEIATNQST